MANFFIDRPIFAWVIAIIIMLAGGFAIRILPVEQYPNLAPPSVFVNANYPGASAETVEESVTLVIEQAMKGIDNVDYMSGSSALGTASVTLTFAAGTDPDIAQVQVQNKLQTVLRQLPQEVQQQGLNVTKQTSGFLNQFAFWSDDGSLSPAEIGDYLATTVADDVSRINGVGTVRTWGSANALRIWLDPYKLNQYRLMPGDVRAALLAQNTQRSPGQLGALPSVRGQQLNATITSQGRLRTPQQFRDIVLRANQDGSSVTLKDVARVEIGSDSYETAVAFNGRPASGLAVTLAPRANALKTAAAAEARIAELSRFFPKSLKYQLSYDTAKFVRNSIREVVITLVAATALVVLIIYLFLGNWHATLVPAVAVPVVLLGTFGILALFGYSINTMTMFAMVLAIGLLVDDAIVVVENVERIMHEEGLGAREATRKSMGQITGALLGIALVLAAVFVPMAFFPGATGVIYRQFAVTIVSAMTLSVLVALVLTPAICASFLRAKDVAAMSAPRGFAGAFNRQLRNITQRYQDWVAAIVRRPRPALGVYALVVAGISLLWWRLPTGFLPGEDQGVVMSQTQLRPGATQELTVAALNQFESLIRAESKAVEVYFSIAGFSFGSSGQAVGMTFIRLKEWDQRDASNSASEVARRLSRAAAGIREASIFAFQPAPIPGMGNSSGFDLQLEDVGGLGHEALTHARDQFLELAAAEPALAQVRAIGQADTPEFHVEIDQAKAATLGLAIGDVNDTLSAALGGSYVNDFINRSRVKKVYMQADAPYRMQPNDLKAWYVRNNRNEMVPLDAIARVSWNNGPPKLERFNGAASIGLSGEPGPGKTSGEAMEAVARLTAQLPSGIGYQWSGTSYEEIKAGAQAPMLYAISVLFVFLCLAALYESWSLPFTVLLVVPLGVIGALAATSLRGLSNDVYFQIALVATIGLSAKNAILIIEFAKKLHLEGLGLHEATLQAVRIRLRPILMTSLAFMMGVLPLVASTGAGSGGRIAIGTGVFGGMLTATFLAIFFVPMFFILVQSRIARVPRL
jgi:multidrug efflux pump